MKQNQFIDEEERAVRTVDRPNGTSIVADLGAATEGVVDVVGDTAIVVTDDDQFEIELVGEPERAFMKNGVLTIDLEDEA